jgi:hypothetical protein
MHNKYSDVRTGVSCRCTCRNCKGRVVINITNTEVLKEVNHNYEHENIANKDFIQFIKDEAKNTKRTIDTVVKTYIQSNGNQQLSFNATCEHTRDYFTKLCKKMSNMEVQLMAIYLKNLN